MARKTVAGHVSDPTVAQRVGAWMRAALGRAELRSLKLVRFGVNDLVAAVDATQDAEVDLLAEEYEQALRVQPELRRGGERHESLRYAARIEAGLRRFLDDGGYGAFTTNFEDLGGLRQLPGIAVQRLMADGYGFGAEGDWKTAILLRAFKAMGTGLPGGTSLMEDYTYHLEPGHERILGAHMLEVCPTIAAEQPSCEIHPLSIGNREDPVRLVFDTTPGPAVVVGLADLGDRFRLVANQVEVVPPDEPLSRLPVARAVWRPLPDFQTSTESWLAARGPHHTVLSSAVGAEELTDLAEMLRTELVLIDGSTTRRGLADQLRWNQAYYRLAQGL